MEIDLYIEQAEKILLHEEIFDEERRDFIKNLNTCDLLAVPGSGKTTALLAKLYCIAQNMPFQDGSGILILSHTNHAIEEIEDKLKNYCPKLFEYPNFIGTVQSFVNKFLANQSCFEQYGTYIKKNDDTLYEYEVRKFYYSLPWSTGNLVNKLYGKANFRRFNLSSQEKTDNTITFIKNLELDFISKKIVYGSNRTTLYTESGSAGNFYLQIKEWKERLYRKGLLNYKDSFNLGLLSLNSNQSLKFILRNRFKYVFIDEMQDLEDFQIKLIDKIFFENSLNTIIQRIGDKNQAIYNSGKKVKEDCDWKTRENINPDVYRDISLQNSMRLSPIIANLVDKFVLTRPANYRVIGKFEEIEIPPHLILIDHNTTGEILKTKFREIIEQYNLQRQSKNLERGFHIISWTTEKDNTEVLCLKKLFPEFSKESKQKREDFDCLKKHLFLFDRGKQTLEAVRKSILNSFIRILELENIKTLENKTYTKGQFINFLKSNGGDFYNSFKSKLFKWCFDIVSKENYEEIYTEIKNYICSNDFIGLNWNNEIDYIPRTISDSHEFVDKDYTFTVTDIQENADMEIDDFPINLSSVHAVKGQTHCATMYVESYYHNYETEKKRIVNILKCEEHNIQNEQNNSRAIQAIKMMYVGFSRPTHLLCFAVLKENINEVVEELKIENNGIWKVVDLVTGN